MQRIADMLRCRRCLSARHVSCNICDGLGSSDAQVAQDEVTFIVDRVSNALIADYRLPYALLLEDMAKLATLTKPDERPKRRAEWAKETAAALSVAKKAKSLSREPTNTPLPNPQTTGS